MDTTIAVAYPSGGDLPDAFDQMSLPGPTSLTIVFRLPRARRGAGRALGRRGSPRGLGNGRQTFARAITDDHGNDGRHCIRGVGNCVDPRAHCRGGVSLVALTRRGSRCRRRPLIKQRDRKEKCEEALTGRDLVSAISFGSYLCLSLQPKSAR